MLVSDVTQGTTRQVVIIDPSDTIADAVDLLHLHKIGAVVATGDGATIEGIISERDIVRHLAAEQEGTLRLKVEDLMTENVSTCRPEDEAESVMARMTDGKFRHMPIVDDADRLIGIVSLGDLVNARLKELEATLPS